MKQQLKRMEGHTEHDWCWRSNMRPLQCSAKWEPSYCSTATVRVCCAVGGGARELPVPAKQHAYLACALQMVSQLCSTVTVRVRCAVGGGARELPAPAEAHPRAGLPARRGGRPLLRLRQHAPAAPVAPRLRPLRHRAQGAPCPFMCRECRESWEMLPARAQPTWPL